jgi:hypothetical protein
MFWATNRDVSEFSKCYQFLRKGYESVKKMDNMFDIMGLFKGTV